MTNGQLYVGTELHAYLAHRRERELWDSEGNEAPSFRDILLDCLDEESKKEFYAEFYQGSKKYNRAS